MEIKVKSHLQLTCGVKTGIVINILWLIYTLRTTLCIPLKIIFTIHIHYTNKVVYNLCVLLGSSNIVYDELLDYSNAVALSNITDIVGGLEYINSNLTEMRNLTNYLRIHASQLNDGKFIGICCNH